MNNPESRRVGLEELALSAEANAALHEENQITEADIRELSAYGFDSDDRTWVGMGESLSDYSSAAQRFDSDDRTLVGIGPSERAERVSRAQELQEVPDSARMPPSEPPGPFIASDADEAPTALPMKKGWPWALALPALLVAASAVAFVRGLVPHPAPSRTLAAAIQAPQATVLEAPLTNEALTPAPESPDAMPPASRALPPPSTSTKPSFAEPTTGLLDIMSSPAASLVLDGRPLGKAPRRVELTPGPHTVLFIHPERGRMSVRVNVRAGRSTSASADF